ncbi:hypothetical protein F5887DRAFT_892342, partial [Amanita rubescens]
HNCKRLHATGLAMTLLVLAEESTVSEFVFFLLDALSYGRGRHVIMRKNIPFIIHGDRRHAETNVCILSNLEGFVLFVQEHKNHIENADAEAWLLSAVAIAAFAENNQICQDLGQPKFCHPK